MSKLKLLSLVMLFMASSLALSSCSDDKDDNGIQITKEMIVGTWNVTQATENGQTIDITDGMIKIVLRDDNSYTVRFYSNRYIGTYTINSNTVIGTTLDPITEYFRFESLNGNNATINYSNSDGDKYVFKATKTK